jgi:hypothetical protein
MLNPGYEIINGAVYALDASCVIAVPCHVLLFGGVACILLLCGNAVDTFGISRMVANPSYLAFLVFFGDGETRKTLLSGSMPTLARGKHLRSTRRAPCRFLTRQIRQLSDVNLPKIFLHSGVWYLSISL